MTCSFIQRHLFSTISVVTRCALLVLRDCQQCRARKTLSCGCRGGTHSRTPDTVRRTCNRRSFPSLTRYSCLCLHHSCHPCGSGAIWSSVQHTPGFSATSLGFDPLSRLSILLFCVPVCVGALAVWRAAQLCRPSPFGALTCLSPVPRARLRAQPSGTSIQLPPSLAARVLFVCQRAAHRFVVALLLI